MIFSISSVSAVDNQTSDINNVDNQLTSDIINNDELIKIENKNEEISSANNAKTNVGNVNDLDNNNANISNFINNYDILSYDNYPSYSSYQVHVNDTIINQTGGDIIMSISPAKSYTYKYYYYLKVYDSNNNEKISKLYYSTSSASSKTYTISSNQLNSGNYNIKIYNYADGKMMTSAKLIVKSSTYPYYLDYSVTVSDTSINYALNGSILMNISSKSSSTHYKYYYYLKVYDSNNKEKISKLYYSTSSASSKTYTISSNQLSPGTYTIKIINYNDNKLMDTAKLIVKSNTYISAENIMTTYGVSKNLIVTLTYAKENLLIGKKVSVKFNGKTYSDTTNSRGQISIKIPNNLVPKTYVASITFAGDDKYIASSGNVNVVVSKATPKITVKSITGNVGKRVKLTATVKDNVGNKINAHPITFKINGKQYKAKTNSKGIATLKVKIPKSKVVKISSKIKNNIVTKTTTYKKTYNCKASVIGDNRYKSNTAKFKVISKNKKNQRYKIVKKETKTITVPYKHWGTRYKTVGHYKFAIIHEQREGNRISIIGGDETLHRFIKFSSNAYYIFHGQKVYPWKWLTSKKNDDVHQYFYNGNAKVYVIIKFNAYTYKKI